MILGLAGRAGAGKDTVAARMQVLTGRPVVHASFAAPLKRSVAALFDMTVEQVEAWKLEDRAFITGSGLGAASEGQPYPFKEYGAMTMREVLQRYGTEAHRDVFGDNFWVDNVRLGHHGRILMVTDVRFPNEAQAVRSAGGHVVRVVGPPGVEDAGDGHASESPLPSRLIDAGIINDVRDDDFRSLDNQVGKLIRGLLLRERP